LALNTNHIIINIIKIFRNQTKLKDLIYLPMSLHAQPAEGSQTICICPFDVGGIWCCEFPLLLLAFACCYTMVNA